MNDFKLWLLFFTSFSRSKKTTPCEAFFLISIIYKCVNDDECL